MVPRVDVFMLPVNSTGEEAAKQLRTHQYSRVVLTKDKSVDEVAGYLYAKDFLLDPENTKLPSLETVKRELLFVPETQSLLDVLRDMQKSQIPIAVVVDEYGGTSGIVTMEDLLEEIVGEIRDELDEEAARVVKVPNESNAWDVDARATMEELRHLGIHIEDEESAETVGVVVLNRLGRIPRIGDKVDLGPDGTAEITSVEPASHPARAHPPPGPAAVAPVSRDVRRGVSSCASLAVLVTVLSVVLVTRLKLSTDLTELFPKTAEADMLARVTHVFGGGDVAPVLVRGDDAGEVERAAHEAADRAAQLRVDRPGHRGDARARADAPARRPTRPRHGASPGRSRATSSRARSPRRG